MSDTAKIIDDRRRMAQRVGLDPNRPDTWPMEALDHWIGLEKANPYGDERMTQAHLWRDIARFFNPQAR